MKIVICSLCKKEKQLECKGMCNTCYKREYSRTEKNKKYREKYYQENKGRLKEYHKKYYQRPEIKKKILKQRQRKLQRDKLYRYKVNARSVAFRLNKKKPLVCGFCNQRKLLERHHPDYLKPKKIVWLCKQCHKLEDEKVQQILSLPFCKDCKKVRKLKKRLCYHCSLKYKEKKKVFCDRCKKYRKHYARNLCASCYQYYMKKGGFD